MARGDRGRAVERARGGWRASRAGSGGGVSRALRFRARLSD